MTVNEVSSLTGVSVRTLHYYDSVGLLKPCGRTEAGYRLYDGKALERLGEILLYKELGFSLEDIRKMLDSPGYDKKQALEEQIELLDNERERLGRLIRFARNIQQGEFKMDFSAFDTKKMNAYREEAKERWGSTKEWKAFEKKDAPRSDAEKNIIGQGLMEVFTEFGAIKETDPASPEAQALVKKLQAYITEHYYPCTGEILASLGQMYAADGAFRENIDKAGGKGTAVFASRAIEKYTEK